MRATKVSRRGCGLVGGVGVSSLGRDGMPGAATCVTAVLPRSPCVGSDVALASRRARRAGRGRIPPPMIRIISPGPAPEVAPACRPIAVAAAAAAGSSARRWAAATAALAAAAAASEILLACPFCSLSRCLSLAQTWPRRFTCICCDLRLTVSSPVFMWRSPAPRSLSLFSWLRKVPMMRSSLSECCFLPVFWLCTTCAGKS